MELAKFLKDFSPCDVSDGLVHLGIKTGGFIPNLTQFSTSKCVVGNAYTVLYAPLSDPRPSIGYIDEIPEGSFLCIGLTKELQLPFAPYTKVNNALYGGLMSTRANYQKVSGTCVFGRIRDLDEHRALDYPVFAYGVGTCAPGPVVKVVGVNVPLEIQTGEDSVEIIKPGDVIIGDCNGVVRVPNDIDHERLMRYIPLRVQADKLCANDIQMGKKANASQKDRRAGLSNL